MYIFKCLSKFIGKSGKFLPVIKDVRTINSDDSIQEQSIKSTKKVRNRYDPSSAKLYKLSRSKLELFMRCRRCFYIDRRLGVSYPDGYPFSLNIAVDALLKKEFDIYRASQTPHPICIENNINAVPFNHVALNEWRQALHAGVQYHVPETNLLIQGGLDDVWINCDTQELLVVEYKSTSKSGEINLNADWQIGYKRQAEIYQWLLRKNGFKVSNVAYFVYCNGKKDAERFNNQLTFCVSILEYIGDDSWVQSAINDVYTCLQSNSIPSAEESCGYCQYWEKLRHSLK